MFGYLVADISRLDESQAERYKAVYCGLCRTLRKRHGLSAGLTLNYDLTFLILLLSSLYEPEEEKGAESCIRHPFAPQSWAKSEISDYAADLNVMLAYLKCRDNWSDDGSLSSLAEGKLLQKSSEKCSALYPRQYEAMKSAMERIWELEKSGMKDADALASAFGDFMGEALVYRNDRWSDALRTMGKALGEFIYVMDAAIDLDEDAARGRYNPFRRNYGLDSGQYFRDILKILLSECVIAFDRLPLVQDAGILKNILCFGLWQQFDKKYGQTKKDSSDV